MNEYEFDDSFIFRRNITAGAVKMNVFIIIKYVRNFIILLLYACSRRLSSNRSGLSARRRHGDHLPGHTHDVLGPYQRRVSAGDCG